MNGQTMHILIVKVNVDEQQWYLFLLFHFTHHGSIHGLVRDRSDGLFMLLGCLVNFIVSVLTLWLGHSVLSNYWFLDRELLLLNFLSRASRFSSTFLIDWG